MWICPRCGRQFKQETREHSCEVYTIEDHLRGKSEAIRMLYLGFEAAVRASGPVSVDALKTMICFRRRANFIAVGVRRERLHVTMLLPEGAASERFSRCGAYGRKTHVELDLRTLEEIDDELRGWLTQAYELAGDRPAQASIEQPAE